MTTLVHCLGLSGLSGVFGMSDCLACLVCLTTCQDHHLRQDTPCASPLLGDSILHHPLILLVQGECARLVLAPEVDLADDLHIGRPAKESPVVVEPELVRGALAVLVALERPPSLLTSLYQRNSR